MTCTLEIKKFPYKHWEVCNLQTSDKLRIVPERGGLITSWICNGREVFYMDQSRFNDQSKSVRGGMPILFPICGNLPNNKFLLDDSEYFMNQHGFARDACWQINPLDDGQGINLFLEDNNELFLLYPFKFSLSIDVRIKDYKLEIVSRVKNKSLEKEMPFSFGLHPYFRVSDLENVEIIDLPKKCIDQNNMLIADVSAQINNLSNGIDFLIGPISKTTFIDKLEKFSITLRIEDPFLFNVIWTNPPRKMICLEPWTSPRNALITGDSIVNLKPNEERSIKCEFIYNEVTSGLYN